MCLSQNIIGITVYVYIIHFIYLPQFCALIIYAHFFTIISNIPVFFLGNFNYPDINWCIPINMGNLVHDKFLTCILQNGLSQLVQQTTRGSACHDLILTTYSQLANGVAITVRGGRTRRAGRGSVCGVGG